MVKNAKKIVFWAICAKKNAKLRWTGSSKIAQKYSKISAMDFLGQLFKTIQNYCEGLIRK